MIAAKTPVGYDRVPSAYKEAIVFSDYWSAYRAVIPSEQQRPVGKETGKRIILSVGIIPYGNSWHASYVRKTLSFSKCVNSPEMLRASISRGASMNDQTQTNIGETGLDEAECAGALVGDTLSEEDAAAGCCCK